MERKGIGKVPDLPQNRLQYSIAPSSKSTSLIFQSEIQEKFEIKC